MQKKKKEYKIGDTVKLFDGCHEEIIQIKHHIGHGNRANEYRTDSGRWITEHEILK